MIDFIPFCPHYRVNFLSILKLCNFINRNSTFLLTGNTWIASFFVVFSTFFDSKPVWTSHALCVHYFFISLKIFWFLFGLGGAERCAPWCGGIGGGGADRDLSRVEERGCVCVLVCVCEWVNNLQTLYSPCSFVHTDLNRDAFDWLNTD